MSKILYTKAEILLLTNLSIPIIMNKTDLTLTRAEAQAALLKNEEVDLTKLDLSRPHLGWFHFTNGTYYPKIVPWLKVDGVYLDGDFYITEYDTQKDITKGKATRKLRRRGYKLPIWGAARCIEENAEQLNPILKALGWPEIKGEYWSDWESEFDESNPTHHEPNFGGFSPGDSDTEPYTTYPKRYLKARGVVQDAAQRLYDFT